ncbi:hypothetical protein ACTXT7_006446 [Hymenolepis weldensis]
MEMNWPPREREQSIVNALTHSLGTPEFVRRMHDKMDENPEESMRGRRFMLTKTSQENRSMHAKPLLNNLKYPDDQKCLWLFSDDRNFHRDEKSIEEMIGGYVWADPTENATVMHAHEVSTNSDAFRCYEEQINADVYEETLQNIIVKPPWIDSVTNGRPPMSSNKSRLHPIKLTKPKIGWPRIFTIMSHQTKLMAAY